MQSAELLVRKAQLRVDLIRNLLGVFAGTGALVALFIAIRRQYVQERVDHIEQELKAQSAADGKHDADERRLTELYVKAAEQLGSEKAPVRLAALYSLARIGADNPNHRQTIVNVICAYLRMPYEPPTTGEENQQKNFGSSPELEAAEFQKRVEENRRRREEREVRLTAQGILKSHLSRPFYMLSGSNRPEAWDVTLDLSYATLIDFDFSYCQATWMDLRGARFIGKSRFDRMESHAVFNANSVVFEADVSFTGASFMGNLLCSDAVFCGGADFTGIEVDGLAVFERAQFKRDVIFHRHSGSGEFSFEGAQAANGTDRQFPHPWRGLPGKGAQLHIAPSDIPPPQRTESV